MNATGSFLFAGGGPVSLATSVGTHQGIPISISPVALIVGAAFPFLAHELPINLNKVAQISKKDLWWNPRSTVIQSTGPVQSGTFLDHDTDQLYVRATVNDGEKIAYRVTLSDANRLCGCLPGDRVQLAIYHRNQGQGTASLWAGESVCGPGSTRQCSGRDFHLSILALNGWVRARSDSNYFDVFLPYGDMGWVSAASTFIGVLYFVTVASILHEHRTDGISNVVRRIGEGRNSRAAQIFLLLIFDSPSIGLTAAIVTVVSQPEWASSWDVARAVSGGVVSCIGLLGITMAVYLSPECSGGAGAVRRMAEVSILVAIQSPLTGKFAGLAGFTIGLAISAIAARGPLILSWRKQGVASIRTGMVELCFILISIFALAPFYIQIAITSSGLYPTIGYLLGLSLSCSVAALCSQAYQPRDITYYEMSGFLPKTAKEQKRRIIDSRPPQVQTSKFSM